MTEQENQKRKELYKLVECFLIAMTRHPEGNVSHKVSELVRERVTYRDATHLKMETIQAIQPYLNIY